MKRFLWTALILSICLFLPSGAFATLLLEENFDYTAGTLLTANGWTNHSGTSNFIPVTSGGLTYAGYPSAIGNAASLLTTGEDVNRTFAVQSSGTVYYAFLVNVTSAGNADYFTHLGTSPWSTTFMGRVFCRTTTGGVNFGITRSAAAASAVWLPSVYATGTTHLLVVKYTFVPGAANDLVDFWVDPASCPDEPASMATAIETTTDPAGIGGVGLRQGSTTPTQWIDGLRIGLTWTEVVCGSATPTGACCAPAGGCSVDTQAACLAAGGAYQGDGSPCTPNPCPQLGTCCDATGGCTLTYQPACAGTWTQGGSCTPNPCAQLGTCCIGGACTFVLQAECTGAWTEGGSCTPNPCTLPTGACCAPDGTCSITVETACTGTWTLNGDCATTVCPQPSGSCCHPDGTCDVTLLANCADAWTMFGVCNPNTCPQPTGACCLSTGACQLVTSDACFTQGGSYQGNFTTCTPNPCPQPIIPLCQVAQDDVNGVALMLGQVVTVEGVALCDGLTWSPSTREFQITDGECCTDIFSGGLVPAIAIGDRVHVTGTVAQYNGKTQLTSPTVTILSTGNPIPTPGSITTADLAANGENYESCLITIHCAGITGGTWPASGANGTLTIDDGSGPATMYIDKDTNIDGTPAPTGSFTVTGIADQFDSSSPYTTGYQIKPRNLADIVYDCVGACCFTNGTCQVLGAAACATAGGAYSGNGTNCSPNLCPQPEGECCATTGECTITTQANCAGTWSIGGTCVPNPCSQPQGACCLPTGACIVTFAATCQAQSGTYQGDGVECATVSCPQPSGSCCHLDGTCDVTLQTGCADTWTMNGSCTPNICVQPTGACCLTTGLCVLGTATDCAAVGGAFQGAGTTCSPNPCAAPVVTVCQVAEDDANGVAVLVGQRVTVEGIALCDGMTWSTTIREFQLTDGDCCVDIFGGDLTPTVALGDRVRITGTVSNYNGKTEITTPDMIVTVLSSGNPIPPPGVTTTGNLAANGEPFESCLFTIHCVTIVGGDPWPANGINANITIDDGTGPVTMRIDKDTNIDGSPMPVGPFTVIGVGDQFDSTSPYTTGYQIKPRMLADLVYDCATGACCLPSGNCVISNEGACTAQGGTYSGDGTGCVPNDCPPPIGACCYTTGICEMLTQAACTGLWLGYGSVCTPDNPCEQPTGSCCYSDGTCVVMPQGSCTGTWTMFGVCVPNTCDQPMGACCDHATGACTVTSQTACQFDWLGAGVVCDATTCPVPAQDGACCDHATGNCTITTQAACQFDWLGAGVPCDATTCVPPTPTERTSWGRIKDLYR